MIMKAMRRNFKYLKYIIILLVVVFIAGFAYSFGASRSAKDQTSPATVNGDAVDEKDFSRAVQARNDDLHTRFGGEVPKQALDRARREVLDAMIEEILASRCISTMRHMKRLSSL